MRWQNGSINQELHAYIVTTIPRQDDRVVASELTIRSIQKQDSGIYTCKATNALKVVTKNITVLVEGRQSLLSVLLEVGNQSTSTPSLRTATQSIFPKADCSRTSITSISLPRTSS